MTDYSFSLDLTLYCKIKNSPAFGGRGTVGYCTALIDDIQDDSDENEDIGFAVVRLALQAKKEIIVDFEITEDDLELLTKEQFILESGVDLDEEELDDLSDCDYQTSLFDEEERDN